MKLFDIQKRIDAAYNAEPMKEPRDYIGASIIGNKCPAYLALSLRGAPENRIDPRIKRVFQDGHRIETEVVKDLRKAGFKVYDVDPMTGKQWAYHLAGGHIAAHCDGHVEFDGEDCILEIKSVNQNGFDKLTTSGVGRVYPGYYDQCQMMMGMSGFKKTLFVARCKNDATYHSEIVEFDALHFEGLIHRAEVAMDHGVTRISKDPQKWPCISCFKSEACWNGTTIKKCSMCAHAEPDPNNGWWTCSKFKMENVKKACDDFEPWRPREKE